MKHDQTTLLSRERGTLPDRYWNQLNGKSAMENWKEQRKQILSELEEEDSDSFRIVSEVKIKRAKRKKIKRRKRGSPF